MRGEMSLDAGSRFTTHKDFLTPESIKVREVLKTALKLSYLFSTNELKKQVHVLVSSKSLKGK